MKNKTNIHTKTATAAIIAAFALCIMATAICGINGTMTARALDLGGSATGTTTCTLKNGGGISSEFKATYERTEKEVQVGLNGETETRYTWTLTVPDEVLAKSNLRSENGEFTLSNGKFVYTSNKLLPSPLTSANLTFVYDEVLELPEEPTKDGYHFVGWYLDEELTVPYNGEPITADMTFYAKFEINTYTVTLDVNGGNALDNVTAEWNTAAILPTPERVGYIFVGWFYPDGTQYDGQAVTADMTLTARWQIKTYTVTFYVDGELYKKIEVKHGMTFQAAMTADLRYYNLLDENGEKISKSVQVVQDMDVTISEMTAEEKQAAFFAQNMWLVWGLVAVAGAGIFSTAIAALVAHKRK